jgi:hypothetical protein
MKMKLKIVRGMWMAAIAAGLGSGCVSFKADKFESQMREWAPPGTTEAKAEKIMTHHGFECALVKRDSRFNQLGQDYLECSRTGVWFHDWNARIVFKDGKVSGYQDIRVE